MLQYIGAKYTMKVETKDSAHSVLFSGLPFYRLSVIFQGSDSLKVVKAQKGMLHLQGAHSGRCGMS